MLTTERILAIECATEACSVALFDGRDKSVLDYRHDTIGRGHAERLIPLIAELPDRGRAGRILVSLGPGSFTGTRIGLAASRALGIAWNSEVRGYPTLALVAAMARNEGAPGPVLVAMTGGHGEIFVQRFDDTGMPAEPHSSLPISQAAARFDTDRVTGSKAEALVGERGSGEALENLPDARFALAIPDALLTDRLAPIYGRPPDAKLPQASSRP